MSQEQALIRRAVSGEPDALEALAVAHRPLVLRTATHLLGDAASAEDATQEVFVRMQDSLGSFRGESALGTWLYKVTLNVCRNELRRRRWLAARAADPVEQDPAAEEGSPELSIDRRRARAAVQAAIDRLPQDQREAVRLRFLSDLPYDEIAHITGVPRGTVASRVFRGLKQLGKDLEPKHLEVVK